MNAMGTILKPGTVVKFVAPVDAAEAALRFTVVEDRDTRVLVQDPIGTLPGLEARGVRPTTVYAKADLVVDWGGYQQRGFRTMTTTTSPIQLAREFASVLNKWLTAEELAEIVRLNAAETNRGICHSHDVCDANQAMIDAWETLGLPELDAASEEQARLQNMAWGIAKAAGFDPANLN